MKKLLVIFPDPSQRHWGGQRLQKLCELLPELGWEPIVVAAPDAPWSDGIWNGVAVHHAFDANPHRLASLAKQRVAGLRAPVRSSGPSEAQEVSAPSTGLARRALVRMWPHYYTGWPPFAVATALRIVRRDRPQAILSSYPPVSSHVAALAVARLTRLPWIADFRDPWSASDDHAYPGGGRLSARVVERAVFSTAAAATAIGPGLAEEFAVAHGRDVVSLPQGIPNVGPLPPRPARQGDALTLLHAGSVGSWSGDLRPLARAALRLTRAGRPVRIVLLGDVWDWPAELVSAREAGVLETRQRVSRDEALRAIRSADVALLVRSRPGRIWVTTKLWDYLAARVPILGLVDPVSDAAGIIGELRAGSVVPYDDEKAIEAELVALHERRAAGTLDVDLDEQRVASYGVDAISARFAALLEEVA